MKKIALFAVCFAVIATFTFLIFGYSNSQNQLPDEIKKVENFTLKDYNGNSHSLKDYKKAKAIVLMFISTQCPVSNSYNEKMNKLYDDYQLKNIAFIGINANRTEDISTIKNHAEKHDFKFAVLKDWNNLIADKLKAQVTPEIFAINHNFEVLYHGRIDDARGSGSAKSNDLKNALDEILAGKEVTVKQTRAMGCTIKRVKS
jgi:peroxiredoxin